VVGVGGGGRQVCCAVNRQLHDDLVLSPSFAKSSSVEEDRIVIGCQPAVARSGECQMSVVLHSQRVPSD
jgi:hypothetical protein